MAPSATTKSNRSCNRTNASSSAPRCCRITILSASSRRAGNSIFAARNSARAVSTSCSACAVDPVAAHKRPMASVAASRARQPKSGLSAQLRRLEDAAHPGLALSVSMQIRESQKFDAPGGRQFHQAIEAALLRDPVSVTQDGDGVVQATARECLARSHFIRRSKHIQPTVGRLHPRLDERDAKPPAHPSDTGNSPRKTGRAPSDRCRRRSCLPPSTGLRDTNVSDSRRRPANSCPSARCMKA